jgi:uncharacterized protein (DUF885 family)
MSRFSHLWCLSLTVLALGACGKPPLPPAPASTAVVPQEQVSRLLERYWDEHIPVEDVIDTQTLADALNVERRFLAQIAGVPRERLDAAARLNLDIFERRRETLIEGLTYPGELMPLNPFGGPLVRLALETEEIAQHPLAAAADYDQWLRRVDACDKWSRQAIANMRDGMRRGYTSPRSVAARMLPLLEQLGLDSSANVFYTPLRSMPDSIAAGERARLSKALNDAVSVKLLPAIRALHDFVARDYLQRTRQSLAMSDLPLGPAWYAYRVRRIAGPENSPAELHRVGLAQVEKLKARNQQAEAGAAPSMTTLTVGDLLNAYQQLGVQAAMHLDTVLATPPEVPLDILATDLSREPASPLFYVHAGSGTRSAVLYVDTREPSPKPAVASFLQHAIPGMHLQSVVQQAADLPRYRRFNVEPAFAAGWGLYAASLGEEMGLYADPDIKAQFAALQMRCAVALVVDTGLNAMGWTLAQALEYLHAQLNIDDNQALAFLDGFAAMPAEALACGAGELKIQALRSRSQQALGSRFDVREFHMQILKDGAMPLDILDAKIKGWTESLR